jgi:hypothetical protein
MAVNRLPDSQFIESSASAEVQRGDPSGAKIAAITSAIHTMTGGEGQITNIERLE